MDLDEKPRPASLEMRNQVLDRDDLPVFRSDNDMLRRPPQRADRGLILRGPDRRESTDRFVVEHEDVLRQENRREVAEALEGRIRLRQDDLIESRFQCGRDERPDHSFVLAGKGPQPYRAIQGASPAIDVVRRCAYAEGTARRPRPADRLL